MTPSRDTSTHRPLRRMRGERARETGNGDPRSWTDRKRCSRCLRVKPLEQFYRHQKTRDGRGSWCRSCIRIRKAELRQTDAWRAHRAEYEARPEVRERRRAANRAVIEKRRPAQRAYRRTARAKLLHGLRSARYDLGRAGTERGKGRILARIAAYEQELTRMDEASERAAG